MARAGRIIAAGDRSNDACLRARRALEEQLGAGPRLALGQGDYRAAAHALQRAGLPRAADILEAIGATDGELRAAAPAWEGRYARRAATAAERSAEALLRGQGIIESGSSRHGIDGALYTPVRHLRMGRPAVVVTTSAGTSELVNFASVGDADRWLASRMPQATGPVQTTADGPGTRTAREDELLAYLLQSPGVGAELAARVDPAAMSTQLRAELLTCWQRLARQAPPSADVVLAAFGRRLLRAPRSAASDIGGPDAERAARYVERLTATPVTAEQARAAADVLAAAVVNDAPRVQGAVAAARSPEKAPASQRRRSVPAPAPVAALAASRVQVPMPVFQPALPPGERGPVPGIRR